MTNLTDNEIIDQYNILRVKANSPDCLTYNEIVQLENCQLEISKRNLTVITLSKLTLKECEDLYDRYKYNFEIHRYSLEDLIKSHK